MLQQHEDIQQQITALLRTYIAENKPISKAVIVAYLREVAGIPLVKEEDVEQAVQQLFAPQTGPVMLHPLSLSQAFLFSPLVYGVSDDDYSFVVLRHWTAKTLCYATYALTRDRSLPPKLILICAREQTILDQLDGFSLCPIAWMPLSSERGLQMIQKTLEEIERLLAGKVGDLKELGPLRVAD